MENWPKQRPKQLTKSAYATLRGWNRSYLSQEPYKSRIAPALLPDGKGGWLVDVAKADEIFGRETDTAKIRKPSAPPPSQGLTEAGKDHEPEPESMDARRRENLRLKNEELQLTLAEKKGQTLPRDGVLAAASTAGQKIREALSDRNPHLAEKFATITDARQILVMLEASDREILKAVSDDFMRRVQPASEQSGTATAH